jgi:hypothetical protein
MVNTLTGLGYGDGINQLASTKSNTASVSKWGKRSSKFTDRRYIVQSALDDETQFRVDMAAGPLLTFKCNIPTYIWYDNSMEVGDTVTIEEADIGDFITLGSYRIVRAVIKHTMTQLELSNFSPTTADEINSIKKQLTVDGSYMQGSTVPLNYSNMDNVADGYPLTLNAHIPSKTVAINSFFLSFDIAAFRGYTGTTSAESTHTHSFSLPNHSHVVTIPDHSHTVTIGNHTHAVTLNNHTHSVTLNNHTHSMYVASHTHSLTLYNHTHSVSLPTHTHNITLSNHTHTMTVWSYSSPETVTLIGIGTRAGSPAFIGSSAAPISAGGGGTTVSSATGGNASITSGSGGGTTTSSAAGGLISTTTGSGGGINTTSGSGGGVSISSGSGGGTSVSSSNGGGNSNTSTAGGGTNTTTGTGSAHTHGIDFGIQEDVLTAVSISIEIDGTDRTSALGGPWSSGQTELNLTPYISTTGKHTIRLLSNHKVRIHADAWSQVFIQSD